MSILPLIGAALVGVVTGWILILLLRPFGRESSNISIKSWLHIMVMSMAVLTLSLVNQGLLGLVVTLFGLMLGAIICFNFKKFVIRISNYY